MRGWRRAFATLFVCAFGCLAELSASAGEWRRFECEYAAFEVPADWLEASEGNKATIAARGRQWAEARNLELTPADRKVRHLVMFDRAGGSRGMIRFVSSPNPDVVEVLDLVQMDDEFFKEYASWVSETWPQHVPNYLSWEGVTRTEVGGRKAVKAAYLRRSQFDQKAVWRVRSYMIPFNRERYLQLTLSQDVDAPPEVGKALERVLSTFMLRR